MSLKCQIHKVITLVVYIIIIVTYLPNIRCSCEINNYIYEYDRSQKLVHKRTKNALGLFTGLKGSLVHMSHCHGHILIIIIIILFYFISRNYVMN